MKLIRFSIYYNSRLAKTQQSLLRLPSFSHFPFHQSITKFIQARDIHTPTFVQYAAWSKIYAKNQIPIQNQNYHIVSPTGSGKTLTYLIPIIDHLKKQQVKAQSLLTKSQRPRALVITSTKQLILQGRNVAKDVGHFSKIKCDGIGIGKSLHQQKQKLQQGVDILFSGYPRFKKMLDHREAFLSNLSWVVIDQVDTLYQSQKYMVQQMFETIISSKISMDNTPKFMFVSTTNPPKLSEFLIKKVPKIQKIVDKNTHVNLQNIKHEFLHSSSYDKHGPLLQQLRRDKKPKTLIFCNTVNSLHELEYFLNDQGIPTLTLHSQLSKQSRLRNYEGFRDSQKGILLSTDLGARGLHFPKLQKVINYDFPLTTCDYLQRAGRTGRAGQKGTVVSLYFKKDLPIIQQLKGASFSTPLKITNSAYGLKNRQQTKRPNKFRK